MKIPVRNFLPIFLFFFLLKSTSDKFNYRVLSFVPTVLTFEEEPLLQERYVPYRYQQKNIKILLNMIPVEQLMIEFKIGKNIA